MLYKENELKIIQKMECEILETVDKYCKENSIEYFVIGGTALGAVRHKGFIPWDDDIDIGMLRSDYNKFLSLLPDALGSPYIISSRESEKNCPFPYPKVRIKGTEFVEYCNYRIKNVSTGIYIDVFPFDKVPDNEMLYRKQFNKVQRLAKFYVRLKTKKLACQPIGYKEKIKALAKYISYYFLKIIPDKYVYKKLNLEMSKYNDSDSDKYSCLLFPKMFTEYIDETALYPLKDYEFEHLIVKGPKDMNTYLTSHYGDYMELPPVEQRVGHRPYRVTV